MNSIKAPRHAQEPRSRAGKNRKGTDSAREPNDPGSAVLPRLPGGAKVLPQAGQVRVDGTACAIPSLSLPNRRLVLVTAPELAQILQKSPEWIRQLSQQGVLVKHARGQYDLVASFKGYLAYREEQDATCGADIQWRIARARLTEERCREQKRRSDLIEGRCLHLQAVVEISSERNLTVKNRLLAIPSKLAGQLSDATSPAICHDILKTEVFEALSELADPRSVEPLIRRYREIAGAEALASERPDESDDLE